MANITIQEIRDLLQVVLAFGDRNQVFAATSDNSSDAQYINLMEEGAFVTTDAELDDAKTRYVSKADIFNAWKRVSFGLDTAGLGNPVPSNIIPGVPAQTQSWSYNSGTDTILSTLNSSSFIGFISPEKYGDYILQATVGASGGDNDFIATVICYVEDANDMVTNNAYGLNPVTYPGVNVTDQLIPNQHTISLVRGRTNQNDFPFHNQTIRYAIVYDMCKLTQKVLANGESLAGMVNSLVDYGAGASCDIKVVKTGDVIDCYTTNWTDGAGGKGTLGHKLSYDFTSNAETYKFRGSAQYGYGALSQVNATFTNISFSKNQNLIYDLRDGTVWVADNGGAYSLDTSRSYYTDYGVGRLLWNPVTQKAIYVRRDKSLAIIGGGAAVGGRFGIEDNTGVQDRTMELGNQFLYITSGDDTNYLTEESEMFMDKSQIDFNSQADQHNYSSLTINFNQVGLASTKETTDADHVKTEGRVETSPGQASLFGQDYTAGKLTELRIGFDAAQIIKNNTDFYNIPLSVNGNLADSTGNITISTGNGGTATPLSDNLTTTTTGTALDAHQGSVIQGYLDSKVPTTRTITINGTALDLSADRSWTIAASGGTVTSVALQMDNVIFNTAVTNSPVTGSGTLAPTLKTQAINTFFAAPSSGSSAAPTFRGITNADIAGTTGLLTALNTTDKTAIVAAINEVLAKVTANYVTINQRINSAASNFNQTII